MAASEKRPKPPNPKPGKRRTILHEDGPSETEGLIPGPAQAAGLAQLAKARKGQSSQEKRKQQ